MMVSVVVLHCICSVVYRHSRREQKFKNLHNLEVAAVFTEMISLRNILAYVLIFLFL